MEEKKVISLAETIDVLAKGRKFSTIRDILTTMNPVDIAAYFDEVSEANLPILFRLLPKDLAADTFVEMDASTQEILIHAFSENELKAVMEELYVDDAVDIIEEMPANVVKRILKNTSPEMRKTINEFLKYPDDSAGSIMTVEYVSLRPSMTVKDAIARIRRTGIDKETIYTCYVTQENKKLLGLVTAKALLLADEDAVVEEIMEKNIIHVRTADDKEEVAIKFNKYGFLAMPVVDDEERLVGIVTVDDAIDVLTEEATEDMEVMAAITPSDKPYLKIGVFETFRQRVPWLLILMISATFTGLIITSFENALKAQLILSAFIPMLMDTAGNSGSQASVTIIRGLSLSEIQFKDIFTILWKEFRVSLLCGIVLGAANFVKMLIIDKVSIMIGAVVCITLVITVVFAKIVGCTLPVLAKKIGFDPAVMASPFITTIVDALSLVVYFTMASVLLGI